MARRGEVHASLWEKLDGWSSPLHLYDDVIVVGAGAAGIATAFHLGNRNLKVLLLEVDLPLRGVAEHTTGKLTSQQVVSTKSSLPTTEQRRPDFVARR